MSTVGVIGLGRMGSRMSERLLETGFDVIGYDLREAAMREVVEMGGARGSSIAEVAEKADLVMTSLPGPDAVEDVFCDGGLVADGASDLTVLETSTSTPDTTTALAEAASEEGIQLVDAPVSGGTEGARTGTLVFMVGADESDLDAVAVDVLTALGERVYYLENVGAGHATKVVNNVLTAGNLAIAMEGMALGAAHGVDPEALFEVISNASGSSNQFEKRVPRVLNRNFEAGFTVDLMRKDVGLALQTAEEIDYPMSITTRTRDCYEEASAAGDGDEDFCAVAKVFEEAAGASVESTTEVDESFDGY